MRAHAPDNAHFGMYFVEDAENVYLFRAVHEASAERVWLTIADEQDGIAAILYAVADMMFHSAGISHSAGGDDDTGFVVIVEQLGLLHRLYVFESFEHEWVFIGLEQLLHILIEILGVAFDDVGRGHTQRTVHIIIEIGETMFFFELIESI